MLIDDFMARYEREYDYYQEAARLCWQRCEAGLRQEGIRAIVTFRVKNPGRLKEKLEKRQPEQNYTCLDDIYKDIVDFAGVRIALYFPGDQKEVEKFINSTFDVDIIKDDFPLKKPDKKRFSGYKAVHYHVRLREGDFIDHQTRYAKVRIEIQVASVLMHAWSEVEHDLAYKPFSGELSEDEYAILDELNGLVLAGEIALERLQRAVKRRVGIAGNQFNNQYELAAYLYDHLQEGVQRSSIIMGRADVLFRFLQLTGTNRAEALNTFITDLNPFDEQRTISNQIIDRIIEGSPNQEEMYEKHERAKKDVDAHIANQASMRFISLWIDLETITRLLTQKLNHLLPTNLRRGNVWQPTASLFKALGLFSQDEEALGAIERLRRLRNQIVHGIESPSGDYLSENIKLLEKLFLNLKSQASEEAREAIESLDKIQEIIDKIAGNIS